MTTPNHQATVRILYDYMLAAHTQHFCAASIEMRHHLMSLAEQLVERLGLKRQLGSQSEFHQDSYYTVPIEQRWNEERRSRRIGASVLGATFQD